MSAQPAIKRRIGIRLVAVCAALLTSACAAGQQAQTGEIVPAVDATSGTIGDLRLHDVAIHSPDGPSYQAGDAAELQLVIVNVGHVADTLTNISSPAASGYQVVAAAAEASAVSPSASSSPSDTASGSSSASGSTSASGSGSASGSSTAAPSPPTSLQVPPDEALRLSITTDTAVLLVKLSKALFPGTTVPITFTFAGAGSVTLTVPVQITLSGGSAGLTIPPPSSSGAA